MELKNQVIKETGMHVTFYQNEFDELKEEVEEKSFKICLQDFK